jgi:hypothetical protein
MPSGIERVPWDVSNADGYLLCFDIPFGPDRPGCYACHYLGIAPVTVESRLRKHAQGQGAKLTAYARKAGIGWTLTRIWTDIDRNEERRLKEHADIRWCPRCRTERIMAQRDPAFGAAISAAKDSYRASVEAGRLAREQAVTRSAGTRRWNQTVADAHEQMRRDRHEAATAWLANNRQFHLRKTSLECVVNETPVITPPMRGRQAVLDAAAAERANAWPDGFTAAKSELADPDSVTSPDEPWAMTDAGLLIPGHQLVAAGAGDWQAEAG